RGKCKPGSRDGEGIATFGKRSRGRGPWSYGMDEQRRMTLLGGALRVVEGRKKMDKMEAQGARECIQPQVQPLCQESSFILPPPPKYHICRDKRRKLSIDI